MDCLAQVAEQRRQEATQPPAQQPRAQQPPAQQPPAQRASWELTNDQYWQRQDAMRSCFLNGSDTQRVLRALCDLDHPAKVSFRGYDALLCEQRSQVREPKNSKDLERLEILHWFVNTVVTATLKSRALTLNNTSLRTELAILRQRHAPPERRVQEAERREQEAERRAQEAERCGQEAKRRLARATNRARWHQAAAFVLKKVRQRRNAACLRRARAALVEALKAEQEAIPVVQAELLEDDQQGQAEAEAHDEEAEAHDEEAEAHDEEAQDAEVLEDAEDPEEEEEEAPDEAPDENAEENGDEEEQEEEEAPDEEGEEENQYESSHEDDERAEGDQHGDAPFGTVQVLGVNYAITLPIPAKPSDAESLVIREYVNRDFVSSGSKAGQKRILDELQVKTGKDRQYCINKWNHWRRKLHPGVKVKWASESKHTAAMTPEQRRNIDDWLNGWPSTLPPVKLRRAKAAELGVPAEDLRRYIYTKYRPPEVGAAARKRARLAASTASRKRARLAA